MFPWSARRLRRPPCRSGTATRSASISPPAACSSWGRRVSESSQADGPPWPEAGAGLFVLGSLFSLVWPTLPGWAHSASLPTLAGAVTLAAFACRRTPGRRASRVVLVVVTLTGALEIALLVLARA